MGDTKVSRDTAEDMDVSGDRCSWPAEGCPVEVQAHAGPSLQARRSGENLGMRVLYVAVTF